MYKISIAAARVNAGMSQKQAAKALGVSNRTICKWEQGEAYPKADKITAMCALYKVPFDMLKFLP